MSIGPIELPDLARKRSRGVTLIELSVQYKISVRIASNTSISFPRCLPGIVTRAGCSSIHHLERPSFSHEPSPKVLDSSWVLDSLQHQFLQSA